jgi:hypothetical protein
MAQRVERPVPPVEPVHARTGAKKTNTSEQAASRAAPSVAQVLAQQNASAPDRYPPAPPPKETLPAPTGTTSLEAMERHVSELGGGVLSGMKFSLNGNTSVLAFIDGTEIEPGGEYVCPVMRAYAGFIKFPDEGRPTEIMGCLASDQPLPERSELGDDDPEKWPSGLDGRPRDPWQPQTFLPLQACDASQELLIFVARSVTTINAVNRLLQRACRHPMTKRGCMPKVRLTVGTFFNKKFKKDQPVPNFQIVGWVNPDGTPFDSTAAPALRLSAAEKAEYSDGIPFE